MKLSPVLVRAVSICSIALAHAQVQPPGVSVGGQFNAVLLPANPTSADNLRLSMDDSTCGGLNDYVPNSNRYSVSMFSNGVRVTLGEKRNNPVPICLVRPREEFDIGRLPAGNYTLTLISAATPSAPVTLAANVAFTVADARLTKSNPYVRLDYSGHWWDPNDSGWGLFVWHDNADNVLAAWFTYGADGKPIWWVFQPRWQTATATQTADLMQTLRAPGPNSPPPNPTSINIVGTASLDFGRFGNDLGETGKITYTIGNGQTLTRTIQRFRP